MAYEIPQELQHKEKILFGLNFQQLGWLTIFGTLILITFKSDINISLRYSLIIIFATFAILFMFFNLSNFLKDLFLFTLYRRFNISSKKMDKFIEIKKIENATIYSHDEIAILELTPINFTIKTHQEKDLIILNFQKFLNSLDFPVQFLVTSHKLDINDYLTKLEQKQTDKELFNNFSEFIRDTIHQNEMRNRKFFLAITKKSNLDIQTQICIERFKSLGIKSRRLNTKEMLDNFYSFFNDSDERTITSRNSVNYLIAPNNLEANADYFKANNKYCRIIQASGYPRTVQTGFLDKIISSNDDYDISIHIEPFQIETLMIMLNYEIQKQRADLYAEELKQSVNPSLEIKYKDTLKVLEELQKGNQKLFNVSLYINCKSDSKENLDYLTKKVEAELNSIMIIPKLPLFKQIWGYKSISPIAKDELKVKRNITTEALSAFFPLTSPFLTIEEDGVMLGLNRNKVPLIRDIYKLSNANGIIIATSGSGKSYFTKLLILRQLLANSKIIIIDPQSEYLNLTAHCRGELITISKSSKTIINPLDLMGHDYTTKRLTLLDLFKVMFGDITEIQKAILDRALNETYAKKGITPDSYKGKKPPILSDLYKELKKLSNKASKTEQMTYQALLNRLYMYTEGVFSFMNKQTSIQFDNNFVCFNIGDMPKQVKPVIMFLILDYVYMKMRETKERKLLVIDEAWTLLGKAEEASYIFEIVKTCRKFNMGLLLITQDVEDLISSKAGSAVLANSSYSLLMRQKPSVIDNVVKMFNLSQVERDYLLTTSQGKGILIMDNEHHELEVIASPKEHELITTNADEILNKKYHKEEKIEIDINLDLEKGLYYGKNLNIEEKNYLANHRYKVDNFVPIGKPRQEECWVLSNDVESLEHSFMVQNIKEELLKIGGKVETYTVQKPDIIYTNKIGEEVAIEVETGKSFKFHKKRIEKKFNELKREYEKIIIVLTDSKKKPLYQSLFPDILILTRNELPELFRTQIKE